MTPPDPDKPRSRWRNLFRRARTAAVAGFAVVLAGCSAYETVTDVFSNPVILPCPKSWVLAEAVHVTRFRDGGGRDLIDVDHEGEITGIQLACATNLDKKTKVGTMEVEVRVLFDAIRGPANRDHKGRMDYFVSVTDKDRKVLYREAFPLPFTFPGNRTRVQLRSEPIVLQLPLAVDKTGLYYSIFAGLTLSHEQLEFNRTHRRSLAK